MINRNTLPSSRALPSNRSIKVYSDNRKLSTQETFLMDYALTHPETVNESDEIRKMRVQIKAFNLATDHLLHEQLNPIVPALHFQALKNGE